jgi:CheY-like chemotaxis protein
VAKILVADGDLFSLEAVCLSLERYGHQLRRVNNGACAIDQITHLRPDIVLTEIMLPMRSGYDILAAIAKLERERQPPVIFFSSRAARPEVERAYAAGVSDFIAKPFDPADLIQRVSQAARVKQQALSL